jgi:hypothetical protein
MNTPATPPPPAPVPPEGMRLLTDGERSKPLPLDAMYLSHEGWKDSHNRGYLAPEYDRTNTHYATRAPLPAKPNLPGYCKVCGEHDEDCNCHPNYTPSRPTSSESSGDVHLRQALDEVERLKNRPVPPISCEESHELQSILRTLTNSGTALITSARELVRLWEEGKAALAAAHTKALAQEGELKQMTAERDRLRDGTWEGIVAIEAQRDAALAQLKRLQDDWRRDYQAGLEESEKAQKKCDSEKDSHGLNFHQGKWHGWVSADIALRWPATPSPAPVAKTNPPAISSPLVDAGEKDSAGPTPRTDEFSRESSSQIPGGGNADMGDVHDHAARLADFARTLERELTASESLRREAEAIVHNAPHSPECSSNAQSFEQYCNCWKSRLTPPVAEEGGGRVIPLPAKWASEWHDMAVGPCACGATHKLSNWTDEVLLDLIEDAYHRGRSHEVMEREMFPAPPTP